LAEYPADGHAVLGRALAEGLRHVLQLPGPAAEAFMDHWSQAAPVATLRARETTLPPSFQGRDRLPQSAATATRARHAIAAGVIASEVPLRVIYAGDAAVVLCTEVILPAAGKALAEAIAGWPRDRCRGNECATPSRERCSSSSVLFRWGHAGAERPVWRGQSTRLRYTGNVGAVTRLQQR